MMNRKEARQRKALSEVERRIEADTRSLTAAREISVTNNKKEQSHRAKHIVQCERRLNKSQKERATLRQRLSIRGE